MITVSTKRKYTLEAKPSTHLGLDYCHRLITRFIVYSKDQGEPLCFEFLAQQKCILSFGGGCISQIGRPNKDVYSWAVKILLQKKKHQVLLGTFVGALLRKTLRTRRHILHIWAYLETRALPVWWFLGTFVSRRVYRLLHVDKDGPWNWGIELNLESNSTSHRHFGVIFGQLKGLIFALFL